jgi:L-threonylcarbamoyladenylate synthase
MTDRNVTTVRSPDAAALADAAAILQGGGLVAFPTETVYGLGADATNGRAVASIFAAKGRPRFNPLIVHVNGIEQASEFVGFSDSARALADAFWPGPLTLVLPRKPGCRLSELASAGLPTVAVRAPAHPVAQNLIAAAGLPIVGPSANPSGKVSATTAAHVLAGLGGRIAMILDGGKTRIGIESTVIGFVVDKPVLLRPGGTPRAAIEKIVGPLAAATAGTITSPGQMTSHYAPKAGVRLNATAVAASEALLAFGPNPLPAAGPVRNLSPTGDLAEAAANLFAMLLELDGVGANRIAVMPIPPDGLGEAINDRLKRASAPRPKET